MAYEPPKHDLTRAQDLSSVKNSTGAVDYHSVLTNVIQMMMKDPAQMRGLVYEMARITLRREAWNKFPPLKGEQLRQHMHTLEDAIARVELDAQAKALAEREAPQHEVERRHLLHGAARGEVGAGGQQHDPLHEKRGQRQAHPVEARHHRLGQNQHQNQQFGQQYQAQQRLGLAQFGNEEFI